MLMELVWGGLRVAHGLEALWSSVHQQRNRWNPVPPGRTEMGHAPQRKCVSPHDGSMCTIPSNDEELEEVLLERIQSKQDNLYVVDMYEE
ncbi:hypothetical protein Trydic_g3854 [Trypoxylus dichotomus]